MAIITITRTEYSGGEQIAEDVAARLGYPVLRRKELLFSTAEDFHFPEAKLTEAMAEPPQLWQQDRDKREAIFNLVRASFLRRCQSERLVYHGYSGQELIREVPHVLRILVIADEADRIETAMAKLGVDAETAREQIKKIDKKLTKWIRYMYGLDWKDPFLYDLVFHLGRVGVARAVETVLEIIAKGDFTPTTASRRIFADELLASQVWAALANNEETSDSYLQTIAHQGMLTISGIARSERIFEAIPRIAKTVEGVVDVVNEVSIGTIWRS